nr:Na(+)-translocating NADH-quinone reductase subunit A [Ruegeria arenilitoris]
MPHHVKSTKGLDLPIGGAPLQLIEDGPEVHSVAILGADYNGLEPKKLVSEGDRVVLGQPLFQQKRDPSIQFTAPASGVVTNIHRGERRALKSFVIAVDGAGDPGADTRNETGSDASPDTLRARLLKTGLWVAFRTRPFSRIPASDAVPRSIFVTACDTRPLSADPQVVVAEHAGAFALGLDQLAKLASGNVYLCTGPGWSGPTGTAASVRHVVFDGPHPSGLPGTHIHSLDPVGPEPEVWHIGYQDVIAIGKLIGEGVIWTERVVALGGTGFSRPRLVRTRLGADVIELTAAELAPEDPGNDAARLVSGCVLSGRHARGAEAYLGRYHLQVSAVPQMRPSRWRPWAEPSKNRFSFGNFLSGFLSTPRFTTDQNGRATAMVPIDAFERVIPMDVLVAPLLKALLIRDTDQAQSLGALEMDEEDLALCSFICPGKNDYAAVLRHNLEAIERDG